MNVVFIGHVDAGKSTLAGQILVLTGQVEDRIVQQYKQDAQTNGRDTWYLAYILDTSREEQLKGKTVECGKAHFETTKKRFTILDAPGHANYVPNMIVGASQADVGVLVISARKGEFEAGFVNGGQTREHALLAKTLGVQRIIVVVNKMDDETVGWKNKKRFDQIKKDVTPFLGECGYVAKDVAFVPISGLLGTNVKEVLPEGLCPWYDGKTLMETLNTLKKIKRKPNAPLRIPIRARYRDGKLIILAKIESGTLRVGDKVRVMPNKETILKVDKIEIEETEVKLALPGENIRIHCQPPKDFEIQKGMVLADFKDPGEPVTEFEAQLVLQELLPHKRLLTPGYKSMFHIHTIMADCEVEILKCKLKGAKRSKNPPAYLKSKERALVHIKLHRPQSFEVYSEFKQLGRFTLRDEGVTIAVGIVTKKIN